MLEVLSMLAEELCSERHEFCSKQKGKITFSHSGGTLSEVIRLVSEH